MQHPSPSDYLYLAAIAAGTATTCWYVHREVRQIETGLPSPTRSARPASGPVRRQTSSRSRGRLAVASPAVAEATARRRLLEAHLRDQLAAEMEEVRRATYAEGYADGVTRRGEGGLS